ncbi:WapI family immunity protein [Brevibacillus sp. TJ4]|uniref:WapI family immunity protein n=1 Tax=Brevibacillus sp. TJ4 TaxID=3234853 RepID=UPI003BA0A13D
MGDRITILSTEKHCLTVEHLYTVEGYLTLAISIKSGEFMGKSNFCISEEHLSTFIQSLKEMGARLSGDSKIVDYDSDSYIIIEVNKLGHVIISGQVGGSHEEHSMKFKFTTDQTILESFGRVLGSLIA